jgi:hypothetical protein
MTASRHRLPNCGASMATWTWLERPWRARLYLNGKQLHLGYYATKAEAREAYADAAKERLGEGYLRMEARNS